MKISNYTLRLASLILFFIIILQSIEIFRQIFFIWKTSDPSIDQEYLNNDQIYFKILYVMKALGLIFLDYFLIRFLTSILNYRYSILIWGLMFIQIKSVIFALNSFLYMQYGIGIDVFAFDKGLMVINSAFGIFSTIIEITLSVSLLRYSFKRFKRELNFYSYSILAKYILLIISIFLIPYLGYYLGVMARVPTMLSFLPAYIALINLYNKAIKEGVNIYEDSSHSHILDSRV
jgi:hypothetical protein